MVENDKIKSLPDLVALRLTAGTVAAAVENETANVAPRKNATASASTKLLLLIVCIEAFLTVIETEECRQGSQRSCSNLKLGAWLGRRTTEKEHLRRSSPHLSNAASRAVFTALCSYLKSLGVWPLVCF